MSDALVNAEVDTMAPIIMNTCFAALYAKFGTINRQVQTCANRFKPPPTYTRDIELLLTIADVIQNNGIFTPSGIVQNLPLHSSLPLECLERRPIHPDLESLLL